MMMIALLSNSSSILYSSIFWKPNLSMDIGFVPSRARALVRKTKGQKHRPAQTPPSSCDSATTTVLHPPCYCTGEWGEGGYPDVVF